MPVLSGSTYHPPLLFRNRHVQTMYPSNFRKIDTSFYERERIEPPDGDFLDLDKIRTGSRRIAVVSHGLEGDSRRPYAAGMARALAESGYDVCAWNYRGCGGEPNRTLRFYHNGATDDLDTVVRHLLDIGAYDRIVLAGFSLGGNLSLVYLGRDLRNRQVPGIAAAVLFSVPCHLASAAEQFEKRSNAIYMKRFLRKLHRKIIAKKQQFPGKIDDDGYENIRNFRQFDDRYTAPVHGFRDAEDYWEQCSGRQFIQWITVPTLIVNALNDPFLSHDCFPESECAGNRNVFLETPRSGGHVGFVTFGRNRRYWPEQRALDFFDEFAYIE